MLPPISVVPQPYTQAVSPVKSTPDAGMHAGVYTFGCFVSTICTFLKKGMFRLCSLKHRIHQIYLLPSHRKIKRLLQLEQGNVMSLVEGVIILVQDDRLQLQVFPAVRRNVAHICIDRYASICIYRYETIISVEIPSMMVHHPDVTSSFNLISS